MSMTWLTRPAKFSWHPFFTKLPGSERKLWSPQLVEKNNNRKSLKYVEMPINYAHQKPLNRKKKNNCAQIICHDSGLMLLFSSPSQPTLEEGKKMHHTSGPPSARISSTVYLHISTKKSLEKQPSRYLQRLEVCLHFIDGNDQIAVNGSTSLDGHMQWYFTLNLMIGREADQTNSTVHDLHPTRNIQKKSSITETNV